MDNSYIANNPENYYEKKISYYIELNLTEYIDITRGISEEMLQEYTHERQQEITKLISKYLETLGISS